MAGKSEEVAVEVLDVDLEMRHALCTVDHHRYAMLMGYADDILYRIDRSKDITDMGAAHYLCFVAEELLVFVHLKHALVCHRDNLQHYSLLAGL